jgi:hypothetical protein
VNAVGGVQKLLTFGLNAEQEGCFRKSNFVADVNLTRIFIFLTTLPYVAFVINDYGFLGLSGVFCGLLILDLLLLCTPFYSSKGCENLRTIIPTTGMSSFGLSF